MIWKHRSDVHILSLLGKCPNSLRTSGAISPKIVGIQFSRFPSLVTLSSCTCLLPAVHRSLKQVVAGRFCHGFSYSRPFGPKKKFGTGQFLCVGAANILNVSTYRSFGFLSCGFCRGFRATLLWLCFRWPMLVSLPQNYRHLKIQRWANIWWQQKLSPGRNKGAWRAFLDRTE